MFSVKELQSLIDTIKQIVVQQTSDVFNKSESNTYGTIVADNGDNTYNVSVAGIDSILSNVINKSLLVLNVGDNVVVKSNIGNLSNGYIALKLGKGDVNISATSLTVSELETNNMTVANLLEALNIKANSLTVDTKLKVNDIDYVISQSEYDYLISLLNN